jgi:hypothetical protein
MPPPGRRASSSEAPERAAGRRAAAVATVVRGGMRVCAAVASGMMRGPGAGVRGALERGRTGPCSGVVADLGCSAIALHRGRPAGRGASRDSGR